MACCPVCNKTFVKKSNSQKYCSVSCSEYVHRVYEREHQRRKRNSFHILKCCKWCGSEYLATNASLYCSPLCRAQAQREQAKQYRQRVREK